MYIPLWLIMIGLIIWWRRASTHRPKPPTPAEVHLAAYRAELRVWREAHDAALAAELAQTTARADAELAAYVAHLDAEQRRMEIDSAIYRATLAARGWQPRQVAMPESSPPTQPTVWGPDKPWKSEAQYRNAVQVAAAQDAHRRKQVLG